MPHRFPSLRNLSLTRRHLLQVGSAAGLTSMTSMMPRIVSAQASGDTLELRLLADIQNLDPAFEPQDYDLQVIFNIYENLVGFRPGTFDLVNTLAEEWTTAADGTRFDVRLKQGIQFHKGFGELTMEDVKFSFERIAGLTEPPIDSPYKNLWSQLDGVEIADPYSGSIHLKAADATLMTLTVSGNVGHVISKRALEELGDDFALNPIGTGPYEFVEWQPRERIVLRRFEEYSHANAAYAEPPIWQNIHFLPIPEASNAEIALETGELDFGEVPITAVSRMRSNDDFEIHERPGFGYKWIGMNVNDPVLSDIRIRKAIRRAIDVPSILTAAFEGEWKRATAILPPSMPLGYWQDAPVIEHDPEAARALLAEAGATDLRLRFTYNNSEPGADTVAAIVQANLGEIGIEVDVVPQENAIAMQTGGEAQDERQIYFVGYGSQGDPAQSMNWFTCDQIDKWNFLDWCDETFTDLAAQGRVELDPVKREEIYLEMQRYWHEQANVVWIAWPTKFFAARQGIEPSLRPDGRMLAWNFRHSET